MKLMLKKILLTITIPLLLWGCAAPPLPDVVWPEPPDPPRIKYVRSYHREADLKQTSVAEAFLLGTEAGAALKKPNGIYLAGDGRIFVTDTAESDVFIFDPANKTVKTLGAMGARVFNKPIGVATDSTGRIFVADSQGHKVGVVGPAGEIISYLQADEPFKQPSGVAVDEANKKLYITDTYRHNISVFDLETLKYTKTIGKRGKEEGDFNFPSFITVDPKGKLYVADTQNGRVQIFDGDGKFIRSFGQFGDAPGMFGRPKGIAVDSEGHIYVVDAAFNNIQIFDEEGVILLAFSGYGHGRGQAILPAGLAIDKDDYIYMVDSWNRRVVVFEYMGEKYKARQAAKK